MAAFLAGQTITAGMLARRSVDVQRTAVQSIANGGAGDLISWTQENADSGAYIAVTATTITIPAGLDGVYSCTLFGRMAANATGIRVMSLEINGVTASEWRGIAVVTGGQLTSMNAAFSGIELAAGATIRGRIFQNSGAALNLDSAIPPRLCLVRNSV